MLETIKERIKSIKNWMEQITAEEDGYANLVVTDPKMELISICGPALLEAGYKIMIFHPYNPEISDAWNMLYHADDWEKIDNMVLSILMQGADPNGKEPLEYFDQQAQQLLDMVCYHLRKTTLGDKATMSHVQSLAGAANPADLEVTLRNSSDDRISINAAGFFSRTKGNKELISSIMSNLPRQLKLWTLDPIRATTSINEIDFAELCSKEKVALFVVTPMDRKEQLKPLFATFFRQLFDVVQKKGEQLGRLPRPLWFLLDEFANLGSIPDFDSFLTVVRGYRVGVVMGIQSLSQLEELYGRNKAKTIVNACATYIISPRIGKEDAEYFSEMLGKGTRRTINKMFNRNVFYTETRYRETESTVPRVLIGPDEIRNLDKNESLIVKAGTRKPVHIAPALYFKDPRWIKLGDECREAKNLQERRKIFYRGNRPEPRPPLESPSFRKTFEEAAQAAGGLTAKVELVKEKPVRDSVIEEAAEISVTVSNPAIVEKDGITVKLDKEKVGFEYDQETGQVTYRPAEGIPVGEHSVLVSVKNIITEQKVEKAWKFEVRAKSERSTGFVTPETTVFEKSVSNGQGKKAELLTDITAKSKGSEQDVNEDEDEVEVVQKLSEEKIKKGSPFLFLKKK